MKPTGENNSPLCHSISATTRRGRLSLEMTTFLRRNQVSQVGIWPDWAKMS